MVRWLLAATALTGCTATEAAVEIRPSERYQTILGWEGSIDLGDADLSQERIARYRAPLLDFLVDSVGLNALRLPLRSGDESGLDRTPEFLSDVSRVQWFKAGRYASANDNDDPHEIDPSGFQFTWLDHLVSSVVLPFQRLLAERGERLYLTLTYVDFGTSEFEHLADPEEYAEFVLAAFLHLKERHDVVPDALELLLEPDWGQLWDAESLSDALIAAGDRLRAHGFEPDIVVPSTTSMRQAVQYFDRIATHPRALEYVTDLAYHRYREVSRESLEQIAERGRRYGIRTAMLEHIGAGYETLHEDLSVGGVSRWQQFALGWPTDESDGTVYALVTETGEVPRVTHARETTLLSQYFRTIRAGAVRIGAVSDDPAVDPLAFENPNGSVAVAIKTTGRARVSLRGLPAGTVRAEHMTERARERVRIDARETDLGLTVTIPSAGVITLVVEGEAQR